MVTCMAPLFLLTVKEILRVDFIILIFIINFHLHTKYILEIVCLGRKRPRRQVFSRFAALIYK
jgi:hypothetical protein